MSREATAWSVKGVDQATRDIARRAAQAAGMTIGEWIDNAIKADSANRGIPVPTTYANREPAPRQMPAEGIGTDTAEAIFERIEDGERLFEARLRPIGYALKDVAERLVAMEKRAEQLPPPTPIQEPIQAPEAEPEPEPEPEPSEPPVIRQPIQLRPIQLRPVPKPIPDMEPAAAAEPRQPLEADLQDEDSAGDTAGDPAERWAEDWAEEGDDLQTIPDPPSRGADADDAVWMDPPPPEPRKPIEFRPAGPRPALSEVKTPPPRPPLPDHPPETWRPDDDLDAAALARDAGPRPDARGGYADQEEAAEPAETLQEPAGQEEFDDGAIEAPRPPPPDPIAPTYDFPAEPIDTRVLGLSGERIEIEGVPRRRIASAGRAMLAALIVIAILGSAIWVGGRQGVLPLGALEPPLVAGEQAMVRIAERMMDWARATLLPGEHATDQPSAPVEVAKGDPSPSITADREPGQKSATVPAPASAPAAPASDGTAHKTQPEIAPQMGTATKTAPAGSVAAGASPQHAPPISAKPIEVEPRTAKAPPTPPATPVAPPAAPTIVAKAAPDGTAASTTRPGTVEPLRRAEAGDPAAQFEVAAGMMRASPPQPEEAAIWFREAAINGLAVAQFNLGVMYDTGLGTPKDDTRALLWYHSAAEQGHPLAQYNLGRLYTEGRGIPQSDTEAKRWFQRAADRGVAAALHALAMYEPGEIEREGMMRRAAQAGDAEAQAWLRARSAGETSPVPLGPAATLVLDSPTGAPDIAAIQQGLANLGYYDGPIDGIAGPVTRAAIGKFQSDNGLPATGLPSRSLRQRLN